MSKELHMGKLGVIAPFKAKEGTITITETAGIGGTRKEPVLSAPLVKGQEVTIDGEMTVKAAGASDTIIGVVYNNPKFSIEPRQNYTQSQAVSADMLREVGIETIFKKIITVNAKSGQGIAPGNYVTWKAEVEKSTSATNYIALSAQDSNNRVIVGFI